ncbi:hypothetical protein C7401_114137 [Paraburkholderia unamae]|uniref:hypothetical protein n=1 Tax=Paraburkholderia unamae TaxID=219649 RepID=UPI000DC5157A|nr:hypothetical protein [Paraburkholderia unamae]RAR57918.1 hypothetical protein C7401_114137 [Paraburkholderia unamae]
MAELSIRLSTSPRAQRLLIWWGVAFAVIFALAWGFLIRLLPLPAATWPPEQVAAFYQANTIPIRIGATICSWTGAFMVPIAMVVCVQMSKLETGWPIWSVLQLVGGALMSMFLVFPPILWGAAAFHPDRAAYATALIHDLANLTLVTTDQYFIFQMVPIGWLALKAGTARNGAFPRWFGFLTIWIAIIFEAGAFAFIPRTGPFAWNGLFVFWFPLVGFGIWISVMCTLCLKAITRQECQCG